MALRTTVCALALCAGCSIDFERHARTTGFDASTPDAPSPPVDQPPGSDAAPRPDVPSTPDAPTPDGPALPTECPRPYLVGAVHENTDSSGVFHGYLWRYSLANPMGRCSDVRVPMAPRSALPLADGSWALAGVNGRGSVLATMDRSGAVTELGAADPGQFWSRVFAISSGSDRGFAGALTSGSYVVRVRRVAPAGAAGEDFSLTSTLASWVTESPRYAYEFFAGDHNNGRFSILTPQTGGMVNREILFTTDGYRWDNGKADLNTRYLQVVAYDSTSPPVDRIGHVYLPNGMAPGTRVNFTFRTLSCGGDCRDIEDIALDPSDPTHSFAVCVDGGRHRVVSTRRAPCLLFEAPMNHLVNGLTVVR